MKPPGSSYVFRTSTGQLLQGLKLRDEGMALAEQGTREQYRKEFRAAVEKLAATGTPFTSEDVINIVGLPSGREGLHKNNAVGALIAGCAKRGVIVRHGDTTQSRRATSHAAELTYWIGAEHASKDAYPYTIKELTERCEKAVDSLYEVLAKDFGDTLRTGPELSRLEGKIEGVRMVLSYIEEMQRGES